MEVRKKLRVEMERTEAEVREPKRHEERERGFLRLCLCHIVQVDLTGIGCWRRLRLKERGQGRQLEDLEVIDELLLERGKGQQRFIGQLEMNKEIDL